MKKWLYFFISVISFWIAVFSGIATFLAVKKYETTIEQFGDIHIVGIFSGVLLCGITLYFTVYYFLKFIKTKKS